MALIIFTSKIFQRVSYLHKQLCDIPLLYIFAHSWRHVVLFYDPILVDYRGWQKYLSRGCQMLLCKVIIGAY